MPSQYTSYCIHTDHSIDSRSWIISSTPPPTHHEQDILWSSKRTLDDVNREIVERVTMRHGPAYAEIHTPVKGWYLLITSPSRAFRTAQKQGSSQSVLATSSTPSSPSPNENTHHHQQQSGRSYINLIPSRTSKHAGGSTEFKFHFTHASSSTNSNKYSKDRKKRNSYTVVETDSDSNNTRSTIAPPPNKGWTTFTNDIPVSEKGPINPFQETTQASSAKLSSMSSNQMHLRTSTFILRPINHSMAKEHLSHTKQYDHHPHTKENRRISLRGIAGLFSATDNSFELIWQDNSSEGEEKEIPILIFEDHPSMLRTETRGQSHLLTSLMLEEFQIPSEEQYYENQQQQQQQKTMQSTYKDEKEIKELYDPITFFVTVGIAYLGFLEDQEAYKAASQG